MRLETASANLAALLEDDVRLKTHELEKRRIVEEKFFTREANFDLRHAVARNRPVDEERDGEDVARGARHRHVDPHVDDPIASLIELSPPRRQLGARRRAFGELKRRCE